MKNKVLIALFAMTFVTDYFANPTWRQDFLNTLTTCQQRHAKFSFMGKLPPRATEWERDQFEKGRKWLMTYPLRKKCRK